MWLNRHGENEQDSFLFFSAAENLFSLMSRTSVTTAFRAVQLLYCVTETLSFIVQHQTGRTHLSTACSGMYLETTVLQYCMATTAFLLKTQSGVRSTSRPSTDVDQAWLSPAGALCMHC